jgi:hypothetical protein
LAAQGEGADDNAVTRQWHTEQGAGDRQPFGERIVGVGRNVGDVHHFALERDASCHRLWAGLERARTQHLAIVGGRGGRRRHIAIHLAVAQREARIVGSA